MPPARGPVPRAGIAIAMTATSDSAASGSAVSPWYSRPWLGVLSRSAAAIFGGYALAATSTACLSLALPMARSQAVLTAMLTGIAVCACSALWAFAARSALRAWFGIGAPALAFGLGAWALGAGA